MSRMQKRWNGVQIRFPRVSGDEPAVGCELDERYMFSPRERG